MKFGLIGIGSGICVDPGVAKRVAQRAEELGFDSLWTGEHTVYPDPREEPSNADPDFPILHPSTSLAYIAGVTERVLLGTGVLLIPQRNPLVLAKELASLDVVSQGRLVLGIGVGYVPQEFAALGVDFKNRGARADEYVAAMRSLWNDSKFLGLMSNYGHNYVEAATQSFAASMVIDAWEEMTRVRGARSAARGGSW